VKPLPERLNRKPLHQTLSTLLYLFELDRIAFDLNPIVVEIKRDPV